MNESLVRAEPSRYACAATIGGKVGETAKAVTARAFAPELPRVCFDVAVTGHRSVHSSYPSDASDLTSTITAIFDQIERTLAALNLPKDAPVHCRTRLLTLLADGSDHLAAGQALERDWELVAPLPFGQRLNAAINAHPENAEDVSAILHGEAPKDAAVAKRVEAINALTGKARLFELADQDETLAQILLDSFSDTDDGAAREALHVATSRRAAMAGSVLIEQADLLIAIWDGKSVDSVGGTGHTVSGSLQMGVPVLWIDPRAPDQWRIYHTAESLTAQEAESAKEPMQLLDAHIRETLELAPAETTGAFAGMETISIATWHDQSVIWGHVYRRIETFFGNDGWKTRLAPLRQRYETPDEIGSGSASSLLKAIDGLPGQDSALADRIEQEVLRRFAWTDGISSALADRYRSGMVLNFVLGAAAIIVGTLYLPLVDVSQKWIFAAVELALLLMIIINTGYGQRRRLHGRWFETRRAAEYLRHSPFLLALGVARAKGRWSQGVNSWWPEWYVRQTLSGVGLPQVKVDAVYLRGILDLLRSYHVEPQRSYHRAKAHRLERVHHRLDHLSELSFAAAVLVVSLYLVLAGLAAAGMFDSYLLEKSSKWFTVAAVALPTVGGAIAAIRYFADFERFADISNVTASELDRIAARIEHLNAAPDQRLDFARVARIVHDTDDIVFSEIENWQAVFSGKRTTIPA